MAASRPARALEPAAEKVAKVDGFISKIDEDAAVRQATFGDSTRWYSDTTADMMG